MQYPSRTLPIAIAAAALIAGALVSCSGGTESAGSAPRHVLLISLDTLRADHCGFDGYEKPTTPFLDTLAERGIVFENHFANSNCTLPSHASMLTGLHFQSHGVRPIKKDGEAIHVLPRAATTLAQRFQAAGYQTVGFTTHGAWLNADYGFDRGFDSFKSSWDGAKTTISQYLEHLDQDPAERTFSFLHLFDIHSDSAKNGPCLPYKSSIELVDEFAGEKPADFTGCSPTKADSCASKYLERISRGVDTLPEEHLDYLVGLYDAGIRKLDGQLEGLFAELERRGRLDDTLVVITADHGEEFQEHGRMLHDQHGDEIARVPLIVLPPKREAAAPYRVQSFTQSTDLAPTLLELCGLERIGQTQSLARSVMLAEEPEAAFVLFQGHILIGSDEFGEFKLIKTGKRPVFFDRNADPGEKTDLLAGSTYLEENRERIKVNYDLLQALIKESQSIHKSLRSLETGEGQQLSPERLAELKALGYLGEVGDEADE